MIEKGFIEANSKLYNLNTCYFAAYLMQEKKKGAKSRLAEYFDVLGNLD